MSIQIEAAFPLGQLVATQTALNHLSMSDIEAALQRHGTKDWGDLCDEDRAENDRALLEGNRLLSAYQSADGVTFWIITERDRSSTTVLLPEDY